MEHVVEKFRKYIHFISWFITCSVCPLKKRSLQLIGLVSSHPFLPVVIILDIDFEYVFFVLNRTCGLVTCKFDRSNSFSKKCNNEIERPVLNIRPNPGNYKYLTFISYSKETIKVRKSRRIFLFVFCFFVTQKGCFVGNLILSSFFFSQKICFLTF